MYTVGTEGDWAAIRKVVAEAVDARLPEACMVEVFAARDEVDNHHIVKMLTDALEKGYALGTVSRVDTGAIDVTTLTERVAQSEELVPKSQRAQALLKLAKIVRKVRLAMQSGDYTALPELCKQAAGIPKEHVPSVTHEELILAQYDAAGKGAARRRR
jgi:hypothetical protein